VVNGRAKSVTREVISMLDQILLGGDLFVSRSFAEASEIAQTVIDRGYGTVLTGGGDGTFTTMVTKVVHEARRQGKPLPRFGFLKLGTGNALAHVVGASGNKGRELAADIQRLKIDAGSRKIGLVEVEDTLTPFCGFGIDARVLEDYERTKRAFARTPLKKAVSGLFGYAVAATTRTIPKYAFEKGPICKVTNLGADAHRIGEKGQAVGAPIAKGEILYEGPARLVGISTIPYYGFGLRAFPFAEERSDRMQLRIVNTGLLQFAMHLGEIWRGSYHDASSVFDYWVEEISIEMDPPTSFQIGGDLVGKRSKINVRMSPKPIRLVDYYAPPNAG
jgi:diacylglycerol kinase family enzyme